MSDHMANSQNEGIPQEMLTSTILTNGYRNVCSFSSELVSPLGVNSRPPTSGAQGFSIRLFGSNILVHRRNDNIATSSSYHGVMDTSNSSSGLSLRPGGPRYQIGNNTSSRGTMCFPIKRRSSENYSFRESAVGESSTRRRVPFGHVNSFRNFNFNGHGISYNNFRSYEQGGSSSPYFVPHFPSPPNVQASSSNINPLPSNVQQNHLPPLFGTRTCEQNQLILSRARVGETFEHILTSTSPELRIERNRLRDQIYRVQQQQLNSGFLEDVIITRYSRALSILDAQERQDQLNSEAWSYVIETGLHEEEIMAYIRREFFQSSVEEQHETCVICQEDFLDGEHIGRLDCGHKYHLACIKQWLLRKNMCPVCKQTALNVEE